MIFNLTMICWTFEIGKNFTVCCSCVCWQQKRCLLIEKRCNLCWVDNQYWLSELADRNILHLGRETSFKVITDWTKDLDTLNDAHTLIMSSELYCILHIPKALRIILYISNNSFFPPNPTHGDQANNIACP